MSEDPEAEKIEDITWSNFQSIVGTEWVPGANLPFDPIATILAKKLNLDVYILEGKNLSNIENALKEKRFTGTHIHP